MTPQQHGCLSKTRTKKTSIDVEGRDLMAWPLGREQQGINDEREKTLVFPRDNPPPGWLCNFKLFTLKTNMTNTKDTQ